MLKVKPHAKRLILYGAVSLAIVTAIVAVRLSDDRFTMGFAETNVSKTVNIASEDGSPQCVINIGVAYANDGDTVRDRLINATIAKSLFGADSHDVVKAANKFADDYTKEYKNKLSKMYAADKDNADKRAWYEYEYDLHGTFLPGRNGLILYTATAAWREDGGKTESKTTTLNFDKQSGQRITLNDVFVPGAMKKLESMLLDKLMAHVGACDTNDLKAKGYLNTTKMYVSQNFTLGKHDITFIYNTHEIASYDKGQTELSISYSEAKSLMRKDFTENKERP